MHASGRVIGMRGILVVADSPTDAGKSVVALLMGWFGVDF